jgi:hypothetical protein
METRDTERTIADMSASAISARLEQVSQLFEVSLMLKTAKKVARPAAVDNALSDHPVEDCSGNSRKVLHHNDKP